MKTKICGECRYMLHKDTFEVCTLCMTDTSMFDNACEHFTPPTNGDKIRQGSDKELVIYKHEWSCHVCIYHDEKNKGCHCSRPNDKTCLDGMIAWLKQEAKDE